MRLLMIFAGILFAVLLVPGLALAGSLEGEDFLLDTRGLRRVENAIPLTIGVAVDSDAPAARYRDFSLDVPTTGTVSLVVRVTRGDGGGAVRLVGRGGALPTLFTTVWDSVEPTSGTLELLIPAPSAGRYYFSVYFDRGDAIQTEAPFQIVALAAERYLAAVAPARGGSGGLVTVEAHGLGFAPGAGVELRGAPGTAPVAAVPSWLAADRMRATLDLDGVAPGTYDFAVVWPGGGEESLTDGFQVLATEAPLLVARLEPPSTVRPSRQYGAWLEYTNAGDVDIAAPLFTISNNAGAPMRLLANRPLRAEALPVLGLASGDAVDTTLRPGQSVRLPFRFEVPATAEVIGWSLERVVESRELVDWAAQRDAMRPAGIPEGDWNATWPALTALLGTTWQEYAAALRAEAASMAAWQANDVRLMLRRLYRRAAGQDTATLSGVLTLGSIGPLGQMRIVADGGEGGARVWVECDTLGRFVVPDLPDGLYTFDIVGNYYFSPAPVALIADQRDVHGLRLEALQVFPAPVDVAWPPITAAPADQDPHPAIAPSEHLHSSVTQVVRPVDPNEKTGPMGWGPDRLISAEEELVYTVYFENVPTAGAAAQEVFVRDYLDSDLDWTTFRVLGAGWGATVLDIAEGVGELNQRVTIPDFREDVAKSWWVDVQSTLNPTTGQVQWTFRTLDPDTGDLPEDALAGFLPPNDSTGRGQGYIQFAVKQRPNNPDGTLITNSATIIFDTERSIETNEVFNQIGEIVEPDGWLFN